MPDSRPNIILIMTDQQRFDTISALGFSHAATPNIDRLVREGVSFTNTHVTAASCAPSRASFFKGQYPHTTGIYKNADSWRHSWVEQLADSGYHCVNIGKMHTWPFETPLGFHERFVVENKDRYLEGRYFFDRWDMFLRAQGVTKQQREIYRERADYGERAGAFEWELPEHTHSDFFVGDLAAWWLDAKPRTEPLFLQIGFPGPHPPYDPVPRYARMFENTPVPILGNSAGDYDGQPQALKELIRHNSEIDHDSVVWSENPAREQLERIRRYYHANVAMIDEKVGLIMNTLEANGYLDDAIVVFTSDHGDCLGDHGHIQKWTMYDAITRVPMIVWSPKRFEGGRSEPILCQQFDILPALFDAAGVSPPAYWETCSLLPALHGEQPEAPRRYVFCEQARDATLTGVEFMSMIRDTRWKLVHHLGNDDGQLYDLEADPDEQVNLWFRTEYAEKRHELLDELLAWRIQSAVSSRRS